MVEQPAARVAAWAIAAVLAVVAVGKLVDGSERPPAAPRVERPAVTRGGGQGGGGVYVHVAGAVRHPGLYRLPPGARVAAALQRAGGPARRADVASVNLAARVQDGQQIVVPKAGAPAGAAAGGAGAGAGGRGTLSLATASVEQLEELDGIGPTLAKRIVEQRDRSGGFRSVDDLRSVDGIGEKRLAALKEALGP